MQHGVSKQSLSASTNRTVFDPNTSCRNRTAPAIQSGTRLSLIGPAIRCRTDPQPPQLFQSPTRQTSMERNHPLPPYINSRHRNRMQRAAAQLSASVLFRLTPTQLTITQSNNPSPPFHDHSRSGRRAGSGKALMRYSAASAYSSVICFGFRPRAIAFGFGSCRRFLRSS